MMPEVQRKEKKKERKKVGKKHTSNMKLKEWIIRKKEIWKMNSKGERRKFTGKKQGKQANSMN